MTRFVAERPDVMNQMEKDQEAARKGLSPEDETLQYLVDRYHPSHRELRRIRNPLGSFTYVPGNERMLIADKTTKHEINIYNRTQRLGQEIGSRKEDWNTVDGATRQVWVKVLLMIPNEVKAARQRNTRMIEGAQEKDKRLTQKLTNPRKYRRQADTVMNAVQAAIRRGRRGGNAAGVP